MTAALQTLGMGLLQSLAVVSAVLAFGLGWAGAGSPQGPAASYTAVVPDAARGEGQVRWLVDGFNVLHAGVLRGNDRRGWWREEMRGRLLSRVAGFEERESELWVVFDGEGPGTEAELASGWPRVVFAPSADDWLLQAVRDAEDPSALVVVTADRQLADRIRHRGARIVSPRTFLARCPPLSV
jgi:predicted RNA-binding protein with PIN domain